MKRYKPYYTYCVEYKMYESDEVHETMVLAHNKAEAYDKAAYEVIPYNEDGIPYSAWVSGATYQNGNHKRFNTHEGKPY